MACLQRVQNLCHDLLALPGCQAFTWDWMFWALNNCRQFGDFQCGKMIHCLTLKMGFSRDTCVSNNLMSIYSDFMSPEDAHQVLSDMPIRNVVSWTTLISSYTRSEDYFAALGVYKEVIEAKQVVPKNGFFLSAALKACSLAQNIEVGKSIHHYIVVSDLQFDTILMNSLLDMYVKCGSLTNAKLVFDAMLNRNVTSWNTIIAGYCKVGGVEEALNIFYQMPFRDIVTWNSIISGLVGREDPRTFYFVGVMHREGCKLDEFAFPCILNYCGNVDSVIMGKQIHAYMVKLKMLLSFAGSALVNMYSRCSELKEAENVFCTFKRLDGTPRAKMVLWNSMISAYVHNSRIVPALSLVCEAHASGLPLDSYTFGSILKAVMNISSLRAGMQIHGLVITTGFSLDFVVGTVLLGFYVKCGESKDALRVFSGLSNKDVIAWACLIWGCVEQGSYQLAVSLFKKMVNWNVQLDPFVIPSVLKACSCLVGIECGKQLHGFCIKEGYMLEEIIITSLIDMYSKCGDIEDSLKLFEGIDKKDTVCWTSIIVGSAHSGRAQDAIKYLLKMLKLGKKPNAVTFLGALSACRHAGFVEGAREIFRLMRTEYVLDLKQEHYSCMIDLLGRAGHFEEVELLLTEMPCKPDHTIWISLLGACAIHKDVNRAKRIAEHLLTSTSNNISVLVAISNAYACLGLWDSSAKIRELIWERGLKDAGRSWIQVNK